MEKFNPKSGTRSLKQGGHGGKGPLQFSWMLAAASGARLLLP
jgi:hypothetical protein